jgi:predicted transcriptional regulator
LQSQGVRGNHLHDIVEILAVCRQPQSRVQILEETGLSMRHLHFCLKHLLKQDLVRFHHRKKTYVATGKGLRYLQLFTEIQKD